MDPRQQLSVLVLIIGLGVALGGGGCGGGSSSSPSSSTSSSPSSSSSISISISPSTSQIPVGGTQQFKATVSGSTNTAVTWLVNGVTGGNSTVGTISSSGLYKAPSMSSSVPSFESPTSVTVTAGGQTQLHPIDVSSFAPTTGITVTAKSEADTSTSASATVTVVPLSFIAAGNQVSGNQVSAGVTGAKVVRGTSTSLLLVGNGFVPGTTYFITGSGISFSQPSGTDFVTTTDGLPAVFLNISISSSAALGPRNIVVTNAAGELSVFVGGLLVTQ